MPSLLDAVGTPQEVIVNGVSVPVHGCSIEGVAMLLRRFPEFQALLLAAKDQEIKVSDIKTEVLFDYGPKVVHAVIAALVGKPGDEAFEAAAAKVPLAKQVEILLKGKELTLPDGISPFVDNLLKLGILELTPASKSSADAGPDSTSLKQSSEPVATTESSPAKS